MCGFIVLLHYDAVIQPEPQKDEIGVLVELLKRNEFQEKTLIIADRGYESYNLLAHLIEKPNTDFLIRVKQNHSAMREIACLPMIQMDGHRVYHHHNPDEGRKAKPLYLPASTVKEQGGR